jgi:hypothetical protein
MTSRAAHMHTPSPPDSDQTPRLPAVAIRSTADCTPEENFAGVPVAAQGRMPEVSRVEP